MFGFVSLLTASMRQLREFGMATAIGIVYCGLLAMFFLPAALSLLKPPTPFSATGCSRASRPAPSAGSPAW